MSTNPSAPTVVAGILQRTSPSAIELFSRCQTAWWLRYVAHAPDNTRASVVNAQNLGTETHSELEAYLKHGTPVKHPFARALMQYAPARGDDLIVEGKTETGKMPLRAAGILVTGRMDWAHARLPQLPIIADWKTRKDAVLYQKTEAELLADIQMVCYGKWGQENLWVSAPALPATAPCVSVAHLYVETKHHRDKDGRFRDNPNRTPRTDRVLVNFTLDRLEKEWSGVEQRVEQMKGVAGIKYGSDCQKPSKEEMADRAGPCNSFGGCPYRVSCPHQPFAHPVYLPGYPRETKPGVENMPSLRDIIAKNKAAQEQSAAPAPTQPVPTVAVQSILPPDAPTQPSPATPPPSQPAPGLNDTPISMLDEIVQAVSKRHGIPSAPPPSQPSAATPPAALLEHTHVFDAVLQPDGKHACTCGKKKPGRPPKAAAPASTTVPQTTITEALKDPLATIQTKIEALSDQQAAQLPSKASVAEALGLPEGFSLYVNCMPSFPGTSAAPASPVTELSGYAYEASRMVAQSGSALGDDPRLADKNSPLAYGGWKGALSEYVRDNPPSGHCVVYTNGNEINEVVAAALAPIAKVVVRG